MPSALLLVPIQLLKMNVKLTAALPPPCFLLHLIACSKVQPESLGKQRTSPLQKLQQDLVFFLLLFVSSHPPMLILYSCCSFPTVFLGSYLSFPAGRLLLVWGGWAENPAGFCCGTACSFWSQAPLAKGTGHPLAFVSKSLPHLPDIPLLPRCLLQPVSFPSARAPFFSQIPTSLGTSSSFW